MPEPHASLQRRLLESEGVKIEGRANRHGALRLVAVQEGRKSGAQTAQAARRKLAKKTATKRR